MQAKPSQPDDLLEQTLALLEKEQRDFEGHWIWDKLKVAPQEFFRAFRKHVESLSIPQAQWELAYQKAQDEIRIKTKEKLSAREVSRFADLSGFKV